MTFQMAEAAVSRQMLADTLSLIARPRAPPAPSMRRAGRQVWQATRGEGCLGTGKAARFRAPVP